MCGDEQDEYAMHTTRGRVAADVCDEVVGQQWTEDVKDLEGRESARLSARGIYSRSLQMAW